MTEKYRIWSLARQKFLVLKLSSDGTPEITCNGTGDEDGTGDAGSCILERKVVSRIYANGYCFEFQHMTRNYALYKDQNGNITAKKGPANDPVEKEAIFVPVAFGNAGPFKALRRS
ncbi:hypothetical protein ACROYT_G037317 [Oculina patagonica]